MRKKYDFTSVPTRDSRVTGDATAQQALKSKRLRAGLFSMSAIALVIFSMTWNPPTGSVHSFTRASDYDPKRESGCTNSGEGCHGQESAYRDFNAYHPNATCTTCHRYQGVGCIPCHSPDGHECVSCHDGTMEGAGDQVRLYDPYPRGHYRETTHTATGTHITARMRAAEGGDASAACSACHARDLWEAHQDVPEVDGSPYGGDIGCSECHNDTRANGLEQVKEDWPERSCEVCHATDSSSPMHDARIASSIESTEAAGCDNTGSGCHVEPNLHAMHADAPKDCSGSAADGEPGCHDLSLQSHVPTATACGGGGEDACHSPYATNELSHKRDDKVHSPGRTVSNDTSFYGVACGRCHDMRDNGASLIAEHELPTSARAPGGPCRGCHNHPASEEAVVRDWPGRKYANACDDCHGVAGLDKMHDEEITDTHQATDSAGCALSGPGCHDTDDLSSVRTTNPDGLHDSCLRCHDRARSDGNRAYDPSASSCGATRDCHNRAGYYTQGALTHQDADGAPVDGADRSHTAGSAQENAWLTDTASGVTSRCGDCHAMPLGVEHARPNSAISGKTSDTCRGCHNANDTTVAVVRDGWPSRASEWACEACHGPASGAHAAIETAHRGVTLGADGRPDLSACSGGGCHPSVDLRVLHRNSGCTTIGCHAATGDISGLGLVSCGGTDPATACHTGYRGDRPSHRNDLAVHAPGLAAGADDSYHQTPCGSCHDMRQDGVSLITEHALATSVQPAGGPCRGCHNHPGSANAIAGDWPSRERTGACGDCHGIAGIDPVHPSDVSALHRARGSAGCASSGIGCHDTSDLSSVRTKDPNGLHETCLRCHDRTASGGNRAYDPEAASCGASRSCHNTPGFWAPSDPVHPGQAGQRIDGTDPQHTAGAVQANAGTVDPASGVYSKCGDCHAMALGTEHTRPNASLAATPPTTCAACHNHSAATAGVVRDGWPGRASSLACSACHAANQQHAAIETAHRATTLDATGTPVATACVRSGCHATADLRVLHARTGCTTSGCHRPSGDIRGSGVRTCGGPAASGGCHAAMHAGVNGNDPLHTAGPAQANAGYADTVSGRTVQCLKCHNMSLRSEHTRPNASIETGAGSICTRCHTATPNVRQVIVGDWAARETANACAACHTVTDNMAPHKRTGDVHFAVEYSPDGTAAPGACVTAGCHMTTDVRRLHRAAGCNIRNCHVATGDIRGANRMRCGGSSTDTTCHRGRSAADHLTDHSADLTGTVKGVTYGPGENVGCFGCHFPDLILEHQARLGTSTDGGGSSACRMCHHEEDDRSSGVYSDIAPVRDAISGRDRRCIACHRSGSSLDTSAGVASPHRALTTDVPLPPGLVWSDPFDEWREALDARTGGGHNALPKDLVGAARDDAFPRVEFEIDGVTYPWPLPANSGATAWLRTVPLTPANPNEGPSDPVLFPEATSTAGIRAAMVRCDDCHEMGPTKGPQGAGVTVTIDPDYAQTEWANPTPNTYPFDPYNVDIRNGNNPPGYKPVICVKCHLVYARSRPNTTAVFVGGTPWHNTHASRRGEVCIDCHVRIPHAWRRPRLLVSTVATDGVAADVFPYARDDHRGLTGIILRATQTPVTRDTCATGGCYSDYYQRIGQVRSESATDHPLPWRDLSLTAKFWP